MKIRCMNQKSKKCCGRAMIGFQVYDLKLWKNIKFCPICGSKNISLIPGTPEEIIILENSKKKRLK